MSNFTKNTKRIKRLLLVLPVIIAAFFIADVIYINGFNSELHITIENAESEPAHFYIDTREDSGSSWLKRDFDLDGESVDLNAQTFDCTAYNNSDYEINTWTATLYIQGDCYINSAWCGSMEIHQHAGTADEKVQTIDLRSYGELENVSLDYVYDGDLLIPLSKGDYIIYYPSEAQKDKENLIEKGSTVVIGFILYYLDAPDLTHYTMSYQYNRSYTEFILFYVAIGVVIFWILLLIIYIISRMAYRAAQMEMEVKKTGISSMSDMYSIIYIIDLVKNELIPITADDKSEKLRPKELGANEQLQHLFEWDTIEAYRDAVIEFCDLNTVADRLKDRKTLVCEYVSRNYGWCRLRFFVMDRGADNKIEKLVFAIRVINDEKEELDNLNKEVQKKTEDIVAIQQKIVVGMANIIENRDNSTGGHVKRTSDVMRILVSEIEKQKLFPLDPVTADDIVRAAPMHDLGKISIDSSILCKPGKLTDEEFAIMKTHSSKSGEMVKLMMDGVEEEHFVSIAFNIARYHHERWDGHGYPDGLKGEDIPLEARIMAVADVYDALVSKRCYKNPMSFDKAYDIMCEGMGSQFDPQLKTVFTGCHERLEEYYRSHTD